MNATRFALTVGWLKSRVSAAFCALASFEDTSRASAMRERGWRMSRSSGTVDRLLATSAVLEHGEHDVRRPAHRAIDSVGGRAIVGRLCFEYVRDEGLRV